MKINNIGKLLLAFSFIIPMNAFANDYGTINVSSSNKNIYRNNSNTYAKTEKINQKSTGAYAVINITNGIYQDGIKEGISKDTLLQINNILMQKIDIQSNVKRGDRLFVYLDKSKEQSNNNVRALRFQSYNNKNSLYALSFYDKSGIKRYYDENGVPLEKSFLRIPLASYNRISSNFNPYRMHPVLKKLMPHYGVDIAANYNSQILASADGIVEFAGVKSGYGNVVYLNNGNNIETRYGHMNKIVAKEGQRVRKGQLIGYVGATGCATGPHLHYEYRINDKPVDPIKVKLPTIKPLSYSEMVAFNKAYDSFIYATQKVSKKMVAYN